MAAVRADRPMTGEDRGTLCVLGNLDGVHQGHAALMAAARAAAAERGAPLGAVTFDPHPRRFFQPDAEPFLLTTLERKAELLEEAGATRVFAVPFDRETSSMGPERFVEEVLIERLGLAGVVVGADFQFGKGRAGNADMLAQIGATRGLFVGALDPVAPAANVEKFSSSDARAAIEAGDVEAAARILGRPWDVDGRVREGEQRGRTIGFPTANLDLGDLVRPANGVYAVTVRIEGESEARPGVANFGRRPTVGGKGRLLEVHLFDFEGDLYGETLRVAFRAHLRDERKFDGLDALRTQIGADCDRARAALGAARS